MCVCAMFVFIDMILSHALGIHVLAHVTCKQGWADQPVQRCSRICTALVFESAQLLFHVPCLKLGFCMTWLQNVIES